MYHSITSLSSIVNIHLRKINSGIIITIIIVILGEQI